MRDSHFMFDNNLFQFSNFVVVYFSSLSFKFINLKFKHHLVLENSRNNILFIIGYRRSKYSIW